MKLSLLGCLQINSWEDRAKNPNVHFAKFSDHYAYVKAWVDRKNQEPNSSDLYIQMGDMDIRAYSSDFEKMPSLEDNKHAYSIDPKFRCLLGEFDPRDLGHMSPNCWSGWGDGMGGWGDESDMFYFAGAKSLPSQYRQLYRNMWPDEEISESEFPNAFDLYMQVKPRVVLSHGCPNQLSPSLPESRTGLWLQKAFEAHQPEIWVFSHLNVSKQEDIGRTHFVSLEQAEEYELEF